MSQFRNSMMLYRPSFSCWTARKKDKDQSDKANKDAGAVDGAANVYKALLPDSPELLAVQKWVTATRTWIYNTTLPWDDNGGRVARVEKHMDFMTEAGDRMVVGYDLVEQFLQSYARAIEEAKFKLNGMFNALDYPSEGEVRRKFYFAIECEAVPEAADFRIIEGLPPEEVERLVSDAKSGIERRVQGAVDEAFDRLREVVEKYHTTLFDFGEKRIKKFNDTLVSNVRELASIMPALNLTNDAQLEALAIDALKLCAYDLKDLRTDAAVRNAAIAEARVLSTKFPGVSTDAQFAAIAGTHAAFIGVDLAADGADRTVGMVPALGAGYGSDDARQAVAGGVDPTVLGSGWGE